MTRLNKGVCPLPPGPTEGSKTPTRTPTALDRLRVVTGFIGPATGMGRVWRDGPSRRVSRGEVRSDFRSDFETPTSSSRDLKRDTPKGSPSPCS